MTSRTEAARVLRGADPRHVLIDTQARTMRGDHPVVYLAQEKVDWQGNAVGDAYDYGELVLSGRPTSPPCTA